MVVQCVASTRAGTSALSVNNSLFGGCDRVLVAPRVYVVPRSLPVTQPRIQFSVPLNSLETRPDCYRVYAEWCDDVEDDLKTICTGQLGLGLSETRRIVHAAREHHTVISIFLNPARVLARVYSWRLVEQELTGGTCGKSSTAFCAQLFGTQPNLISFTSRTLQKKVKYLKELFDEFCTGEEIANAIRRRPQLLQRSTASLSAVFDTLKKILGQKEAARTLMRYPELFSRAPETIEECYRALEAEVGGQVAVRMVVSNPSTLVRKDMEARFERVCKALNLPREQATTVICSLPTILNIPPETLHRRLRILSYGLLPWCLTPACLKPSVLGRLLTSPDARLMRLSYLSFLHGFANKNPSEKNKVGSEHTVGPLQTTAQGGTCEESCNSVLGGRRKAPLSFVIMPEDEFLRMYPRFPRWVRRKNRSMSALGNRSL